MISPQIVSTLMNYWQNENVACFKASFNGALLGTELAEVWEAVGMPFQEWWSFRFTVPSDPADATDVSFGTIGSNWRLHYRPTEDICFVTDQDSVERFGNSTFGAFAQMLMLFDAGCKTIQKQCGGDSGEDWNRGDLILERM